MEKTRNVTRRKHHKAQRRQRPKRREKQSGLVVCEGVVTEKQYVEFLMHHYRQATSQVVVKCMGVGKDPLTLLHKARAQLAAAKHRGSPYDWCCLVVDVDNHHTLTRCLDEAANDGEIVIVSNPCFEMWLLWHYEDAAGGIQARELRRKLETRGHKGKSLPSKLPIANALLAASRANVADPHLQAGRVGPSPSSAMPVLLKQVGIIDT